MAEYQRRSYHSQNPSWRNSRTLMGSYVGVELEVETSNTPYQQLLSLLPDIKGKGRPLAETDGSLSYVRGVELVFPPLRPSTIKRANSAIKKIMESLKNVDMSSRGGVGMHLNINCSDWTSSRKWFAVAAVVGLSRNFFKGLGGRSTNMYCSAYSNPTVMQVYECTAHDSAASLRGDRIELRFPKSTTDPERLDRLLDFVNQLEAYTQTILGDFPSPPPWPGRGTRMGWVADGFLEYMKKNKIGKRVLAYVENQNNSR